MAQSSCFLFPLADSPLLPFLDPFTYLETLLAVTGSVHLGLRLLVNWPPLSQPFPIPSPLQIPSTQVNCAPYYDDFKNPASLVRNMYSYVKWCFVLGLLHCAQLRYIHSCTVKDPFNWKTNHVLQSVSVLPALSISIAASFQVLFLGIRIFRTVFHDYL
jgi:hypothetical protein